VTIFFAPKTNSNLDFHNQNPSCSVCSAG